MTHDLEHPVDFLISVMESQCNAKNFEGLARLEHGLQCATNAERDGASPALIAASLLHDIGSVLRSDYPELAGDPERGHEEIGAEVLARWFGPEVTEPVALHVMAKRHLVAVESGYAEKLSPISVESLKKQGLALTPGESEAFLRETYAKDALALRRWDEDAKVPGAETPDLVYFRPMLEACLATGDPAQVDP